MEARAAKGIGIEQAEQREAAATASGDMATAAEIRGQIRAELASSGGRSGGRPPSQAKPADDEWATRAREQLTRERVLVSSMMMCLDEQTLRGLTEGAFPLRMDCVGQAMRQVCPATVCFDTASFTAWWRANRLAQDRLGLIRSTSKVGVARYGKSVSFIHKTAGQFELKVIMQVQNAVAAHEPAIVAWLSQPPQPPAGHTTGALLSALQDPAKLALLAAAQGEEIDAAADERGRWVRHNSDGSANAPVRPPEWFAGGIRALLRLGVLHLDGVQTFAPAAAAALDDAAADPQPSPTCHVHSGGVHMVRTKRKAAGPPAAAAAAARPRKASKETGKAAGQRRDSREQSTESPCSFMLSCDAAGSYHLPLNADAVVRLAASPAACPTAACLAAPAAAAAAAAFPTAVCPTAPASSCSSCTSETPPVRSPPAAAGLRVPRRAGRPGSRGRRRDPAGLAVP